jgi:hypothetical protein
MAMGAELREKRKDIEDVRKVRRANAIKGEGIKEAGRKLSMDNKQLEGIKKLVDSLNLPSEEKAQLQKNIRYQEQVLKGSFEFDVEKPSEELLKKQRGLSDEAKGYSDNASKNEKKINEFKKKSDMDDSRLKQAGQEQGRLKEGYRNEAEGIEKEREDHKRDIAELRREVGK